MPPGLKQFLTKVIVFAFLSNMLGPLPIAQADELVLPQPGVRIALSPAYQPSLLMGMQVDPKNPFQLNFIFDPGQKPLSDQLKRKQYRQIVEYFLASLTIPNHDMWVNLSPYEKNRIIPDNFGQTYMGRDLLSEDYLLKQITSSLIYPEENIGKKFWQEVYRQAQDQLGTTDVPVNTFNKVWIVPDKAEVFEKNGTVVIISSHLKVMLEEDYEALKKNSPGSSTHSLGSQIVRKFVLPALEKEINEGKNFAMLRQIYSAMLMATWFKKTLRQSILGQTYADRSKLEGINLQDTKIKERIYQEYLKAFKKGVFNFIQEDYDPVTHETIPRKYFAGGMEPYDAAMIHTADPRKVADFAQNASTSRWDTADVLLQQFLDTQVFPKKEDRRRFAGKGHILNSIDEFDEKNPDLGWISLTDHIIVRFVNRKKPFSNYLRHKEIRREPNDPNPIFIYRLPQDITVREIPQLVEEMQKLPLANQEKIILPQTAKRFLQLAQTLSQGDSKEEYQEFTTALVKIADELGGSGVSMTQGGDAQDDIKDWFGVGAFEDLPDVPTMMARVVALGVQSVQIELEELTFWRGENLFRHILETSEDKRQWAFDQIDLDDLRRRINQHPAGTPEADNEIIKAIQEILTRVRALPGLQVEEAVQILEQESPSIEYLTNRINCVGKSALMALYLNALGIKVWAVDVHAYQKTLGSAEHVLLLAQVSGYQYYVVEPSSGEEKSHEINLSLDDNQIPAQGMVLHLSEGQDPDLKNIYIGPWRQMITAMFYSSLGGALMRKGDVEGSIAAYRKAIILYPNYASAYSNLGGVLRQTGDIGKALAMYEKATQLNPYNFKNWDNWGLALYNKGDVEGAIVKHNKAIQLNPNDPVAWNNLGVALYKKRDMQGAIEAYQEAIKVGRTDPKFVTADNNLQLIFKETGQYERAVEFYRELARLNPENSRIRNNVGFFLGKLGYPEEALVEYEEAIKLDPDNSIPWDNLGTVLWNKGDKKGALRARKEAFRLNPDNKIIMDNLESSLSDIEDFQGRVALNRNRVKHYPNDSIAYNNLGFNLYKLNNIPAAKRAYQKALIADPNNDVARDNLREIEEDHAMTAPGGIDFNEDLLDMRIKRDGKGFPLSMQLQDKAMLNIQGLAPVIVKILPFDSSFLLRE